MTWPKRVRWQWEDSRRHGGSKHTNHSTDNDNSNMDIEFEFRTWAHRGLSWAKVSKTRSGVSEEVHK